MASTRRLKRKLEVWNSYGERLDKVTGGPRNTAPLKGQERLLLRWETQQQRKEQKRCSAHIRQVMAYLFGSASN